MHRVRLRLGGLLGPLAVAQARRLGAPCLKPDRRAHRALPTTVEAPEHIGWWADGWGDGQDHPRSAYVHLPFCKRRCYYCDFPIRAVGPHVDTPAVQSTMEAYVELLCTEIRATAAAVGVPLRTVYFGGGTPSLVPPALLGSILAALRAHHGIEAGAEMSMEADPGTFDAARLREYMDLGVTRFSIGVQAFQQDVLEACGRSHGLADVHEAIDAVKAARVRSWSLDLISGLPHADEAQWRASLAAALDAAPDHVSVYDLQVEEGTRFGRLFTPGEGPLPSNDLAVRLYQVASQTLCDAGYEHYEVSSYARPGHRCKHNMVYWSGRPYQAFGLGAASYLQRRRFSRPKSMAAYRQWVLEFAGGGGGIPGAEVLPDSDDERLLDMVMLHLRLADGLDLTSLAAQHGEAAAATVLKALQPHAARGLVEFQETGTPQIARLSDPNGFLVSNHIISDIFAALD